MFNTQTGTWYDYLPIILLIFSAVSALVPSGLLLWLIREMRSGQKELAQVQTHTALNSENIDDLEVKVQKVHDRNHTLTNSLHALEIKILTSKD